MRSFLKKIGIYIAGALLLLIICEYLLRNIPNDYRKKAAAYDRDAEKFQVLVLGSSYGLYDVNPAWFDLYTFNGGHALQSLDLDLKIFSKYEKRFTKLRYLVMPITFASFFFKLESSKEARLIKNYCVYYGLRSTYDPANYLEMLNQPFSVNRTRIYDYYFGHHENVNTTDLGFDSTYRHFEGSHAEGGVTASKATEALNIENLDLYSEQEKCLEQIIGKCAVKNIRVILFTPPAYKTFYSSSDTLELNTSIRTCEQVSRQYSNVRYINFLADTSFVAADYFDMSHLDELGAKKLSLKINGMIRNDK